MILKVQPVEVSFVNRIWPLVESFVKEAMDKGLPNGSPNYNEHHVRQFVASGQWVLLVAIDDKEVIHGAATVSFINYPLHRVAFITTIGGKLVSNTDTYSQLKNILKLHGATKLQGYCRDSMVRLWQKYGANPGNRLVEEEL